MHEIGDTIRYKSLFKWREGTVIDIRKIRNIDFGVYAYPYTEIEYMIRTKRNKIKVLKSDKIF
ncbi:hypothetical protein UT300009_29870 [Paraclostridium bifermentans]